MTRIDLDDLPPKVAELLQAVAPGEEVLLVKDGLVFARLTGGAPDARHEAPAEPVSEATPQEIFEQFRSIVEDEF